MKALVRKELREYAALWILPLFLCVSKAFDRGLGERFLGPSLLDQLVNVLVMTVPAAALLGFAQMVREEKHGTLSYLVHRELGMRRLIAAKAAAGLLMVAGLAFLPPLASYLSAAVFSPLRDVLQPMRLVEELCLATAAFAGYGAGVLAATLRGRLYTRGAVGLALALGVLLFATRWMAIDDLSPRLELVLFPLTSVAACAGLLFAASLAPTAWAGRESAVRGARAGRTIPRALAVLVLLVPTVWFAASAGMQWCGFMLLDSTRAIVAMEASDIDSQMSSAVHGLAPVPVAMPPRHQEGEARRLPYVVKEPLDPDWGGALGGGGSADEVGGLGARWLRIAGSRTSLDLEHSRGARAVTPGAPGTPDPEVLGSGAWLDLDAGVVRVVLVRGDRGVTTGTRAQLYTLAPAEGRLSPETFEADLGWSAIGDDADPAVLLDPRAKRLYALHLGDDEPTLEPLALPGGDALVAWAPARGFVEKGGGQTVLDTLVLRGERGDHVRLGGRFIARPAALALAGEPPTTLTLRSDHDPLRPRRAAIAPDGSVIPIVERPLDAAGRVGELFAFGCTLALSPLGAVAAYASEPDYDHAIVNVFQPALFVGGRRGWLLGVQVGLALVLAGLAWRRLGGRRANVPRAALWGIAILVIGPVAFAAHVLCEPAVERRVERGRAPRLALVTEAVNA